MNAGGQLDAAPFSAFNYKPSLIAGWAAGDQFSGTGDAGLMRLRATVRQRTCSGEALIPVTDSLIPSAGSGVIDARGLPGYTIECASGELWRSRFDATRNVIVVNNGHRHFVFASRTQALKLRYLVRLMSRSSCCEILAAFPRISFSSA